MEEGAGSGGEKTQPYLKHVYRAGQKTKLIICNLWTSNSVTSPCKIEKTAFQVSYFIICGVVVWSFTLQQFLSISHH